MTIESTFVDVEELRARVLGCPLQEAEPPKARHACATCALNAAFPGEAEVGCQLRTPPDVFAAAQRDPEVAALIADAQAQDAIWGEAAERLAARAQDVWTRAESDAAREVAAVIANFARAGAGGGYAVRLLR